MKLRALELEQFRKFGSTVRLSGFGDRVNVLCGPNEFGKSTILVAIRALFFERHNSKSDPIKRMQSWRGNAAPRVAMEFETGGGLWRIEKRFLHQPMARLTAPDGGRFDGDAAEEELQRLLGFGASGKQGAKPEHMGVWGALWVTQRDSVLQADLSSDLARATVTSCLDAEVGVMTGNEKGQALIRAVREQRGQFLDGNGKPKNRFRQVTAELDLALRKLAELADRSARLSEDAAAFTRHNELLAKESDPAAEVRDRDAVEDARRRKEAALLYDQRLLAAQAALTLAARDLADVEAECVARKNCSTKLDESRTALQIEQDGLGPATAARAEADAAFAKAQFAEKAAQNQATEASADLRRIRNVADIVRRAAVLAAQTDMLKTAEAVQDQANRLAAQLETLPVGTAQIDAIRKAARDRDLAHSVLQAQATQISFAVLPEGAGKIVVGGMEVNPETPPFLTYEDTEIAIDGIGRITVHPAIRDFDKFSKRLQAAEDCLRDLLAQTACSDAAQAEQRHAERQNLERALADAQADLTRLVPGDARENLAPGLGPLRQHVALLERKVQEALHAANLEILPSASEVAAEASAADGAELAASEALVQIRAELDAATELRATAREALQRAEEKSRVAAAEIARLEAEAAFTQAREPDAALAVRLQTGRAEQERCKTLAIELERGRPQDTAELMRSRIERYEQAIAGRQQTIRRLRETIAELRARIAQEGGHGLDEQIAAAERQRDALKLEQENFQRETRVLGLLLDTLLAAERDTKERYLAPVIRRVTPYLRSLFPGADIACNDALRITGLTRADLSEDFDRLSDGTQEQIAVLARLAFAEMLIDQGKPAMVILDDALAYADADRMERMFDVLTTASAKTQILVLTCRKDLFSRLGGNRVQVMQVASSTPSAELVVSR